MYDNARLFFSILWLLSVGAFVSSAFLVVLTWGEYLDFFYLATGSLAVATFGCIVTAL